MNLQKRRWTIFRFFKSNLHFRCNDLITNQLIGSAFGYLSYLDLFLPIDIGGQAKFLWGIKFSDPGGGESKFQTWRGKNICNIKRKDGF